MEVMPSRGRHQSTSGECRKTIEKIEAIPGIKGVIIGRSYGGKSLGRHHSTGSLKIQRETESGFKAAIQSAKGLQELFILMETGKKSHREEIARLDSSDESQVLEFLKKVAGASQD